MVEGPGDPAPPAGLAPAPAPAAGPPPGPGVQPPFVAAPIEGRRARTWLGLGLAGAVLAGCCGVGVVGVGGLVVLGQQAVDEQAQRAVDDYLAAVTEQDWQKAYDLRCARDQRAESLSAFTDRVSAMSRIESYQTRNTRLAGNGDLTVPVQVTYADGSETTLTYPVEQNPGPGPDTGQLEVCGQVRPA
jgi:hypothetical protein